MLLEVFASGPIGTNVYLIGCEKTHLAVVVDAPADCTDWIIAQANKHSLSIKMILLTHSHWDHTADTARLKEKLQAPVYVHQEDAGNVENPGSDGLPLLFPIRAVKPDGFLSDGQLITVGDLQIEVIHTPGHTPGCVCFYLPKEKVLISGDTLFQGSIGRIDLPTARKALMWTSLKKLAKLPSETTVYPGHGDSTTIGDESWLETAEKHFSN